MSVVDLFSGVGGLGLGFKLAGFNVVAAVELNPKRSLVYKRNVKPTIMINSDVRKVDFTQFRNVDGIIAGPPCQPYSNATPKSSKGINHPFFGLDFEVVRAVRQVKPRFIVIEEVPAWKPNGIVDELRKLNYDVYAHIYNMNEHGVPMKRRRWIVVAIERGLASDFAIPMAKPPNPGDVLSGLPEEPCGSNPCMWNDKVIYDHVNVSVNSKLKDVIPLIPPGYSLATAHRAGLIDASKYVKDVNKKHSYWLYRIHPNEPLPTVPHPRRSMLLHPFLNRIVTVRELARLYTFPDWFSFKPLSIDEMYSAITDSVPPLFAMKIAAAIKKLIS